MEDLIRLETTWVAERTRLAGVWDPLRGRPYPSAPSVGLSVGSWAQNLTLTAPGGPTRDGHRRDKGLTTSVGDLTTLGSPPDSRCQTCVDTTETGYPSPEHDPRSFETPWRLSTVLTPLPQNRLRVVLLPRSSPPPSPWGSVPATWTSLRPSVSDPAPRDSRPPNEGGPCGGHHVVQDNVTDEDS